MKRKINKIVSLMLVFCIMVSLVTVTGISANAATNDEVVAGYSSGNFEYRVIAGEGAKILGYYGTDTELVIPSTIDGYTVTSIGEDEDDMSLGYNSPITSVPITSVTIPDTVTKIGARAFMGCKKLTSVNIPDSVITIEAEAFRDCTRLRYFVVGKNVKTIGYNVFNSGLKKIYIPKSVTSINEEAFPYSFVFTDIYYEGSKDDWEKVCGYNYANAYWFNLHYNCPQNSLIGESTIESDDFTLTLSSKDETKEFGEIALPAGTYEFNVRKGDVFNVLNGKNVLGYNKVINDSTVGSLTCSAKYKNKITLVATGGVYSFQFDKSTNKLIIKRTGDLPDVYLVGGVNAILTPVKGTNLSVGSVYLSNYNGYRFNVSKNGTILGKNTVGSFTNTTRNTPISLSEEYIDDIWCTAYGGMYTFIFNRETNQLSVRQVNDKRDLGSTDTIHVTGDDFNLDLDDNNGESDMATGTITLKKGYYSFKVYNRGVACGSNSIYYNAGTRTLSPNFMLPSVLYASGGKYKFTFEKSTGRLFIHRA
ncbi:MAG: leucine-rich repeat domain-containing protein [Acutalibacteraceae bacterium]